MGLGFRGSGVEGEGFQASEVCRVWGFWGLLGLRPFDLGWRAVDN